MAAQEQTGHRAPIYLLTVPNSSPHLRDLMYMCVASLNPHNTSIAVLCTLKPRNAHTLISCNLSWGDLTLAPQLVQANADCGRRISYLSGDFRSRHV